MEFPYNPPSNLPFMYLREPVLAGAQYCDAAFLAHEPSFKMFMSVTEQTNQNLCPSQKERLLLHQKLGHTGFQWCQKLCQTPRDLTKTPIFLPKSSQVSTCDPPLCAACQLGKQTSRSPNRGTTGHPKPMQIRKGDLNPGDCVSGDQCTSALPGRLPHTKGKNAKSDNYNGGTIFVDQGCQKPYLSTTSSCFSTDALASYGTSGNFDPTKDRAVLKLNQRTDNLPFGSASFQQNVKNLGQKIDFLGNWCTSTEWSC